MDVGGRFLGESCVENHNGLPRDSSVHECKAPAVGTQAMLEVLPVSEGMDSLIGTDPLKKVAGGLPGDVTQLQQLWSEPLAQDALQVADHLS